MVMIGLVDLAVCDGSRIGGNGQAMTVRTGFVVVKAYEGLDV
jgi:hypothetical protein